MHSVAKSFVVVALIALGGVSSVVAQTTTGKVDGHVYDAQKRPIAHAHMIVVGTAISAMTDSTGYYLLDNIPVGPASIRATYIGYKPREVAGIHIVAGTKVMSFDFTLQPAAVTLIEISPTTSMLLRFQLIRPTVGPTTDPAVAGIDSVLRDLFHWRGYRLLSEAAMVMDLPANSFFPGNPGVISASQVINADGIPYTVSVVVDSSRAPRVRLTVSLTGGSNGAGTENRILLSTTLTMTLGHTVVLGSAQPGGAAATACLRVAEHCVNGATTKAGDVDRTIILTVKPELHTP